MASKEMYDYLATATPDNAATLTVVAQGAVREAGTINQEVHIGDDGSRETITLSTSRIFYIDYPYNGLTEADAGTIVDCFFNASIGNGRAESFNLAYADGHTYVVKFDSDMPRDRKVGNIHSIMISFAIIGRIAD